MLSFDISAIDIVLLVAMLVLFVLLVAQKRNRSAAEPRLNLKGQGKLLEKPKAMDGTAKESRVKKQSAEDFQSCTHQFGYLRGMPKNSPIPDECFGCHKVLRCMFQSE